MVQIKFTSDNSDLFRAWHETATSSSHDVSGISSVSDEQLDPAFTCVLLPATIVYDRLGQRPIIGRAEVFSTAENARLASDRFCFIVTTVLFPGNVRLSPARAKPHAWSFEPEVRRSQPENIRKLFLSMLSAVDDYNDVYGDRIKYILVDLEVVNSRNETAHEDARAASGAIFRHRMAQALRNDRRNLVIDVGEDVSRIAAASAVPRSYNEKRTPALAGARDFYFTSKALESIRTFSYSVGEVLDATLSGSITFTRPRKHPYSYDISIDIRVAGTNRDLNIYAVFDEKRGRLTIREIG